MEMEISKQSSGNTNDQRVNIYIYIYTPNRPSWINSFTREWIGHFALK